MRRTHRFKKPCNSIATDVTPQHHHEGTQKMKNIMVVFAAALVPSILSLCLSSPGCPTFTAKPMCLRVCVSTRLQAEMDWYRHTQVKTTQHAGHSRHKTLARSQTLSHTFAWTKHTRPHVRRGYLACNQNRRNLEAQKQLEELWVTSLEQDDSW